MGQTTSKIVTREKVAEKWGGAPHSKMSLRLWLKLLTCTSVIEKQLRNRLREDFDITLPRFDVLAALDRAEDDLSMGDLSKRLFVSNGNITGVVSRLEKEGYVSRSAPLKDRRTYRTQLTKKGREEFSRMAGQHEDWIDHVFAELSTEEIVLLLSLLDKIPLSLSLDAPSDLKD